MAIRERTSGESERSYYKYLARLADQRLSRLEGYQHDEHFKGILNYAYKRAQHDIAGLRGEGFRRFGQSVIYTDTDQSRLHEQINAVKRFLESPTSTKTGVIAIYKKRAETTNKVYGTSFTWEDLANYYEADISSVFDSMYGSKTEVRALGALKRVKKWNDQKIQDAINGNIKLSDDMVVNQIARDMLRNGLDPKEIFKK